MKGFTDWVEMITVERVQNGFVIETNSRWVDPQTTKHFVATNREVVEFIDRALSSECSFDTWKAAADPEPVPA